jgi:hypothetical protein
MYVEIIFYLNTIYHAKVGVEFWQVNLRIDTERVDFLQLFRLPHDY